MPSFGIISKVSSIFRTKEGAAPVRPPIASRWVPFLAAAVVLAACLRHGAGLSPDTVGYLGMARSILDSGTVSDFLGQPVTIQPPLYPMLLAAAGWITGGNIIAALPWLNSGLFCAAIFLFGCLARRILGQSPQVVFLSLLAVVSTPLLEYAIWATSEMSYIIVTLGFMILLIQYCTNPRAGTLAALIFVTSLAPLIRYIGVTWIAAGAMVLLVAPPQPLKRRLRAAVLFGAFSSGPVLLWWLRNYHLAHNLTGVRAASMFSLPQNIGFAAGTVVGWFLPKRWQLVPHYTGAATLVILLGLLCLCIPGLRRHLVEKRLPQTAAVSKVGLAVLAVVFAIHSAFLIITSTTTAYDIIADRLMVPVYPCFLLLLAGAALRRPVKYALLVPLLAVSLLKSGKVVCDSAWHGKGYAAIEWEQSALLRYVTALPHRSQIYSNIADVIYLRTGEKTQWLPHKYVNHMTLQKSGPPSQSVLEQMKSAYLIYYQPGTNLFTPYLYSPHELEQWLTLHQIGVFDGGTVYQVVR